MIVEFLCNIALSFFDLILSVLPDISLTGLDSAIEYFFDILRGACYFLPMDTVASIFSIIYALFILRLLIATLKTIWAIIPIL